MSRSKHPRSRQAPAPRPLAPAPVIGEEQAGGCLPALLRLTWLLFGNLGLALLAVLVASGQAPGLADAAFFALAAALVAARHLDVTRFRGLTSEGAPATLAHWRRYAVTLAGVAAGLYGLARLAASRGWL